MPIGSEWEHREVMRIFGIETAADLYALYEFLEHNKVPRTALARLQEADGVGRPYIEIEWAK